MIDFWIRPMRDEDVEAAEALTDEAFYDLDVRTQRADAPPPERRTQQARQLWVERHRHMRDTDPAGSWVAEASTGLIGTATSLRRDLTWVLATLAVLPGVRGRGVGRQLLDAALSHGRSCLRGMLCSSADPFAVRRYRQAGFTLHPAMFVTGKVPRPALPVVDRIREGGAGDIDLCNSVDRRVRDAAHGVDHEILLRQHRLVVVDRPTGTGYAYVGTTGAPALLAATNRRTATDLLWECLAASTPEKEATVMFLTAEQQWAVDVALAARMEVRTYGYLAVRGMKPPAPYIPHGHFL